MPEPVSPAPSGDALLQIGDVVERTGLSLRTVRYYEEVELVVPESRTAGGYRLYTEAHVERLARIMQMKPLGFSIQEMREVLDARDAVRDAAASPEGADARATLQRFATLAAERLEKRRRQLADAASLPDRLRHDAE